MTQEEIRAKADALFEADVFLSPNGFSLPYRYHRPESPHSPDHAPLMLMIHGSGSIGNDNRSQLFLTGLYCMHPLSNWRSWNILAPQCPAGNVWVDYRHPCDIHSYDFTPDKITPSLAAVQQLLHQVIQDWDVDPDRIFVGGCSMGGYATWEMVARNPHLFAGAVLMCAGTDLAMAPLVKDTPARIFHGGADDNVFTENSRMMVAELKRLGAQDVVYTEYPGVGHNSWTPALSEDFLFQWLNQTRRPHQC